MTKPRLATLLLFILAMLFYALSWTSVASGFAIFAGVIGFFFEAGMWLSLFRNTEKKTTSEMKNFNEGVQ